MTTAVGSRSAPAHRCHHLRRFGGLLHTSLRIGPKSREQCRLATGLTRGGRCNRRGLEEWPSRVGVSHRSSFALVAIFRGRQDRCEFGPELGCIGRCSLCKFERGRTDIGENTSASCDTTPEPKMRPFLACLTRDGFGAVFPVRWPEIRRCTATPERSKSWRIKNLRGAALQPLTSNAQLIWVILACAG